MCRHATTVVEACLRRGVDIETLHVDVCTELDLFGAAAAPTPGARRRRRRSRFPIYRVSDRRTTRPRGHVVRDAVRRHRGEAPAAVHQS